MGLVTKAVKAVGAGAKAVGAATGLGLDDLLYVAVELGGNYLLGKSQEKSADKQLAASKAQITEQRDEANMSLAERLLSQQHLEDYAGYRSAKNKIGLTRGILTNALARGHIRGTIPILGIAPRVPTAPQITDVASSLPNPNRT